MSYTISSGRLVFQELPSNKDLLNAANTEAKEVRFPGCKIGMSDLRRWIHVSPPPNNSEEDLARLLRTGKQPHPPAFTSSYQLRDRVKSTACTNMLDRTSAISPLSPTLTTESPL